MPPSPLRPQSQYSTQVSEALMYLETRLALGISSDYGLCLVTYALALSESASASSAWDTLVGRAQIRGTAATSDPCSASLSFCGVVAVIPTPSSPSVVQTACPSGGRPSPA